MIFYKDVGKSENISSLPYMLCELDEKCSAVCQHSPKYDSGVYIQNLQPRKRRIPTWNTMRVENLRRNTQRRGEKQ